ncbi:type II toxin-antitoxin system prevent-host-death family antitoxin [Candidatus Gottesmanbacteria bacterium]|nr:type II toxin-antitoxin system prevent-host-death family antitoxin [Candidatus Gottesmanbacteria bacterium]
MRTIKVSATEARNNLFTLLNQVLYENTKVIITKADAKGEVVLIAKEEKDKEIKKRTSILNETFGTFKNVSLSAYTDNRLRGKRAKEYLNKVRKGNV